MIDEDFLKRLKKSTVVSKSILKDFSEASKSFSEKEVEYAQERLSKGADALTTFMQWYIMVLQSHADSYASAIEVLDSQFVEPLEKVFSMLSSSEALRSSTALSDILEANLLPMLRDLNTFTEAVLNKALESGKD